MNLMNPLEIAALLKRDPSHITAAIRLGGIKPQRVGLRAGLYDPDAVKKILDAIEAVKQ
jgi:hypothetical protein